MEKHPKQEGSEGSRPRRRPAHRNSARIAQACAILGLGLFLSTQARGQLLDYGTYSGYALGRGILGNDFGQPLPQCITGKTSTTPASHADVRASIIYSDSEYQQALHIEQNAKASFLKIGGGGEEMHFQRESTGSSSAFDIILEAYSEYPSDTIANPDWSAPYAAMMASGDPAKIRQVRETCGDRFIDTVFNEARLFVILHVSSQKSSALTAYSGKANGSVGIGIVQASGSLGGDANISSANQSGALTIEVKSEGLGGIAPLAGAIGIASSDGLASIATKLSDYLRGLTATGQPVKYQLTAMPGMSSDDLDDQRIFDYLKEMKESYTLGTNRLEDVRRLLNLNDQRRVVFNQPRADDALHTQEAALTAYLDSIASAHAACRKASELAACSQHQQQIAAAPNLAIVELPPATAARFISPTSMYTGRIESPDSRWMNSATFGVWLDGQLVAPAQLNLLFSNGSSTLFDEAKQIQPHVSNVDIMAVISSAYVSNLNITVRDPSNSALSSYNLFPRDLAWPAYFGNGNATRGFTPLPIVHADAAHPCAISGSGSPTLEQACLTSTGVKIWNIQMIDLAMNASAAAGLSGLSTPFAVNVQDCFSPPQSTMVGIWQQNVTSAAAPVGKLNYSLTLEPPLPANPSPWGSPYPMQFQTMTFSLNEAHTGAEWRQIALDRAKTRAADMASGTAGVCSRHIP
jgi:hypothetical protein